MRISRLGTQGAFLVTAERRDGETAYVVIESQAGAQCRLVHPWRGATVVVRSAGTAVEHEVESGIISFATQSGSSYILFPIDSAMEELETVELEAGEGGRLGIGGRFEAMSWRDFDGVVK